MYFPTKLLCLSCSACVERCTYTNMIISLDITAKCLSVNMSDNRPLLVVYSTWLYMILHHCLVDENGSRSSIWFLMWTILNPTMLKGAWILCIAHTYICGNHAILVSKGNTCRSCSWIDFLMWAQVVYNCFELWLFNRSCWQYQKQALTLAYHWTHWTHQTSLLPVVIHPLHILML